MTERVKPALLVLLVGVALLLLIACANVANLFLSRGVSRERDLAVRVALGAGRGRLIRELLTESVVVSMVGGVLGIALAWSLLRALPAAAPENFPRLDAVQLDWRALAFAVAASVLAGVLSGLVPALRGTRPHLLQALREGVGASSSRRTTFVRRGLLVAEASLAVMLLVGAALLGRSFVRLVQTEAGYDAVPRVERPDLSAGSVARRSADRGTGSRSSWRVSARCRASSRPALPTWRRSARRPMSPAFRCRCRAARRSRRARCRT